MKKDILRNYLKNKLKDTTFLFAISSFIIFLLCLLILEVKKIIPIKISLLKIDSNYIYLGIMIFFFINSIFLKENKKIIIRKNLLRYKHFILIITILYIVAFYESFGFDSKDIKNIKMIIFIIIFSTIFVILSKKEATILFLSSLIFFATNLFNIYSIGIPMFLFLWFLIGPFVEIYKDIVLILLKLPILIVCWLFLKILKKNNNYTDHIINAIRCLLLSFKSKEGNIKNDIILEKPYNFIFLNTSYIKGKKFTKKFIFIMILCSILECRRILLNIDIQEFEIANFYTMLLFIIILIIGTLLLKSLSKIIHPKLLLNLIMIIVLLHNPILNIILFPIFLNVFWESNIKRIEDVIVDICFVIMSYYAIFYLLDINKELLNLIK